MRIILCLLLLGAITPLTVSAEEIAPLAKLLIWPDASSYSRGLIPRKANWQGLFCKDNHCEIRDANVSIKKGSAEGVLGPEPIDTVTAVGQPLFIARELPLAAGPTTTATGWQTSGAPPHSSFDTHGKAQLSLGQQILTLSQRVKAGEYQYFYYLSSGKQQQLLLTADQSGHYDGDSSLFIQWAGDLDGDNKLDLLISIPDDNCGIYARLYLSSLAHAGEFMAEAARLETSEPACGC